MSENTIKSETPILEAHFGKYRNRVIGNSAHISSPYGSKPLIYADWMASGRLYSDIEHTISSFVGPMIANTHSFSSETGKATTYAYQHARNIIKDHVNAGENDVLITAGTGMTGALSQLQRIMGLRYSDLVKGGFRIEENKRPVVFISHMEHHSNHVSWLETIADVVIVPPSHDNFVSPQNLIKELEKCRSRAIKIGAFTACSNVTGRITPYHHLARIMHNYNGYCIIDFAASGPYVDIDMHPEDPEERLDAVVFSPHKFLGGPGSCGILVLSKELFVTGTPDAPGGGNVKWTDPWGGYGYYEDIETLGDGGTPGILQTIRAAMAIRLKEKMGVQHMERREKELLKLCFEHLTSIKGLYILGGTEGKRIGCLSFGVGHIHYNLIVRLLNDRFGIQVRGGWSCASTYGHYLFKIDKKCSTEIIKGIEKQDLSQKPGWVRLSLHPITTNAETIMICDAIKKVVLNVDEWQQDYQYNPKTNEFEHLVQKDNKLIAHVEGWFN